jgi:RNA polymerase sigma-70 factor (ECF subfamily)
MDNPAADNLGLDRFHQYLLLLARAHLGDRLRGKFDPSDVVQQTLLEAHEKREQFRGTNEAELAGWLRTMLACTIADAIRGFNRAKRDVKQERELGQIMSEASSRLEVWLAASQSSPSQKATQNEQLVRLAAALAQLPEDQRRAVEMKHLHSQSVAAIAQKMNRTETAVGGLLRRGMTRLRELMNA